VGFRSELAVSFSRARQLRGGKRLLDNIISWSMVLVGCVLVVALTFKSRVGFGLPMTRAPLDGLRMQLVGWVAFTAVSIPILLWCATVAVGGIFGLAMALFGRFTLGEAKAMALYGQPPAHWV